MERTEETKGTEVYVEQLSFSEIRVLVTRLGTDYNIVVQGGGKPHVGSVVLAVPRPSLRCDGSISVTSSVLNVTGHKDEAVCRYLAEHTARKKNAVAVCAGGFHIDGITEEQIQEVLDAVKVIGEWIAGEHSI